MKCLSLFLLEDLNDFCVPKHLFHKRRDQFLAAELRDFRWEEVPDFVEIRGRGGLAGDVRGEKVKDNPVFRGWVDELVNLEEAANLNFNACFFPHFPFERCLERFPELDAASGENPEAAVRVLVPSPKKHSGPLPDNAGAPQTGFFGGWTGRRFFHCFNYTFNCPRWTVAFVPAVATTRRRHALL